MPGGLKRVVDETTESLIQPTHINATVHLFEAFDHSETEVSAGYIVKMCQERGGWFAFSEEEIEEFYQRTSGHTNFIFNRLVYPGIAYGIRGSYQTGGGWVVQDENGKYRVTAGFIINCYRSSMNQ